MHFLYSLIIHKLLLVVCCPEDVSVSAVSTDTLEINWMPSRGAVLYETRAAHSSEVILCNDTAPVCVLSGLSCDTAYSVVVIPCSDVSGCNRACKAHTKDTGRKLVYINKGIKTYPRRKSPQYLKKKMSPHNFEGSLNNVDTINSAFSPFSKLPACRTMWCSIQRPPPASLSAGQQITGPLITL